ncbi:hypothetical protein FAIPA1_120128 [Frankia sp. AiPs1]|uniref:hypothetical protein n=1 Tax=Frankia sp. AiPa1 TaxID=573492 RepID=UPI00202B5B33|nr:hypothetical protein [Frankia sp. AiPa1]MCL9758527.1 hypothetical protein [Frankia sp. AiPa1]
MAADVLARSDTGAYRHIVTTDVGDRPERGPANRIILPTPRGLSVRRALLNLASMDPGEGLQSHAIPESAVERLRAGDDAGFLRERKKYLVAGEQDFILAQGLVLADTTVGEPEIDTE